jgi:surface polysaccharide O-acyltransferase-like enzyme
MRLREIDFIRAVAALSVIAIHITASFVTDTALGRAWNEIMRYAVPLFIILSGIVLYHAEMGRPRLSYLKFQRKRMGKVLIPYVLWTLLYVLYIARQFLRENGFEGIPRLVSPTLDHLWYGTAFYHLYFLIITFQLYLLYPLLRDMMNRKPLLLLCSSFLLTLFAQTASFLQWDLGWRITFFPNWLFFFVFGMYFALNKEAWQPKLRGRLGTTGILWLVSMAILFLDGYFSKKWAYSVKPSVMLYTICSFFFFYAAALRIKDTKSRFGKVLDWLSAQSFLIFLLHPLVLNLFGNQMKKYGYADLFDGSLGMVLQYMIITLLTCGLTWISSYIPLTKHFGGVYVGRIPVRPIIKQKEAL